MGIPPDCSSTFWSSCPAVVHTLAGTSGTAVAGNAQKIQVCPHPACLQPALRCHRWGSQREAEALPSTNAVRAVWAWHMVVIVCAGECGREEREARYLPAAQSSPRPLSCFLVLPVAPLHPLQPPPAHNQSTQKPPELVLARAGWCPTYLPRTSSLSEVPRSGDEAFLPKFRLVRGYLPAGGRFADCSTNEPRQHPLLTAVIRTRMALPSW